MLRCKCMREVFYTDTEQRQVRRILPDLIRSRGLLFDLVWRELRARYRNAMMGFLWAVLQPMLMALILTFVFQVLGPKRGEAFGVALRHPFPVLVLCGLVPWQFFSAVVAGAARSLVDNQNLVKKVYFPREVVPLSAVANGLVNFVIGLVLVITVHAAFGGGFGLGLVWLPVLVLIAVTLASGLGLLLACLNTLYRDVGYVLEAVLTFGFYASPVFYPLEFAQNYLQAHPLLYRLYLANPMAGLITAYRQAMLDGVAPSINVWLWPAVAAVATVVIGAVVFRRNVPALVDYV